jgi:pSer/pThr/pTyr-binding forkhead associated (FHA) protein
VTSAGGELRLEAVSGNATGFTIVVDERLVIGRQSEGPGKLAEDPELSRHHAEIARGENGLFTITDLASTNGTFVNGERLEHPAQLALGDEIGIGGTKLVVRAVPAAVPGAAAEAVDVRAATVIADDPPPEPEPEPTPLLVRLTVDFEAEVAELAAESGADPIRLELAEGQWRLAAGDG